MNDEQRRIPGPLGNRGRQSQPGQFVPRGKFQPNRGGGGQRPVRPTPIKVRAFPNKAMLHPKAIKYMNSLRSGAYLKKEVLSREEQAERAKTRHIGYVLKVGDRIFRAFSQNEQEVFLNWCLAGSMIFAPWQSEVMEYVKERIREIADIEPEECLVVLPKPWKELGKQENRIKRKSS